MHLPTLLVTWSEYPPTGRRDEIVDHRETFTSLTNARSKAKRLKRNPDYTDVVLSVAIE